ncbi:alpha/beta hydrolase [Allokutzneria albata]|uniref:TAP-like protein n=1 Tax=Allokutzneria albata TaxID=211114 RepID=A0A1G9VNT5_ALLAB|nr:alpha/beta hydrolase [Allokutzneria albata]SDM73756.1 TAP-like protein [Allokutzneria albata]
MRKTLPIAVAFAIAATAVPGLAQGATPGSSVKWGECPAGVHAPGMQCANLDVPLDHRKPDGQKIHVAISRLASKNPAKRRGVLLTNPGGPGGFGLDFPALLAALGLPQSVLDSYDIIGFDPRGVGRSTPVTCNLTQDQQYRGNVPPYARDAAEVAKHAEQAKIFAKQCAESKTAYMLPHTTTANTARDMDRIREALGEKKISFIGYSYGTHLGAVYATLFPQRGDRVVLDSSLVPAGLDAEGGRLFARGLEDRFPDFATFAAAHPEYGLGSTPEQVRAKYSDLAARLDRAPVQGVDGSAFRLLTFGYTYSDGQFPALVETWRALDKDKPLPPTPAPQDLDNKVSSHHYVICNDSRWPRSVESYQRDVAADRVRYPLFGAAAANIRPCAFWQSEPLEPPVRVGDRGPSNVLIAQNTRDPGTPLVGAQQMRRALGDRARMVTADQGGHGVYVFAPNKCANDAVTAFLTEGKRPARDIVCAAEPVSASAGR